MKPKQLFDLLIDNNINCFAGVPDSLLKDFCAYITDNTTLKEHTITANEGNAIALAAGHYLATGNPALVYMQNSGIGNCVNPLLSLTDEEVYNIPLLMLIGWRGEPDKKDEPQHIKQGKVTDKLLDSMGIKWEILPEDFEQAEPVIINAIQYIKETNKPFAFIIKKGLFEKYELQTKNQNSYNLSRETAIETVIKSLSLSDVVISTTGHISREVYETRERLGQSHKQDFLTVGSMGHASSIALGIALGKPDRNIYCFDGDGAFLMHMGSTVVNASKNLKNFKHIVYNNEAHDSVGGQPTTANNANIPQIAFNAGYKKVYSVSDLNDLNEILPEFINSTHTALLEIKIKCGARSDLGRPKEKPQENKKTFMANLNQVDFCYRGAIENLSKIVKLENAQNILVFRGKNSYENIKPIIEQQLNGINIQYYSDFSTNPKDEEVKITINKISNDYDLILAIGGGSVIDFAKAYKWQIKSTRKLVAIPTTAGTGSEATQFAVLYVDGVKTSLDNPKILPNYAIIDSQFVENTPKEIKIGCALDAFCQSIESYWAVNSTSISRNYAKSAMEICRDNLVGYINNPNTENSSKMMQASNLSGKAINISRTTAAHALSYKITTELGLSHGIAVAMSIAQIMELNSQVNNSNCNDYRGKDFVLEKIKEIFHCLGIQNPMEYFNNLFEEIGLKQYVFNESEIDTILHSVNKSRLLNNPVQLDIQGIKQLFLNKEKLYGEVSKKV